MKGLSYKDVQRISRITTAVVLAVVVAVTASAFSEFKADSSLKESPDEALLAEVKVPKEEVKATEPEEEPQKETPEEKKAAEDAEKVADDIEVASILKDMGRTPFDDFYGPMPDDGCQPLRTRKLEKGMSTFCDTNEVHLSAAVAVGIQPVVDLKSAWQLQQPIVKVRSTKDYYIDSLEYSLPYLVPRARTLLADIGRSFKDSLAARGGGDYRIKVTSLLRTPETVATLQKRNKNAVDSSAHRYGTTFDISYIKFICDSPTNPRTANDLKLLLMEILDNLRSQGRCYIKSERKQSCFHITTR